MKSFDEFFKRTRGVPEDDRYLCPSMEKLLEFVNHSLSDYENKRINNHLEMCPHCSDEIGELSAFMKRQFEDDVLEVYSETGYKSMALPGIIKNLFQDKPVKKNVSQALKNAVELIRKNLVPVFSQPIYSPVPVRDSKIFLSTERMHFQNGMAEYSRQNFHEAIKHLRLAAAEPESLPESFFYLGISYLITEKHSLAAKTLKKCLETGGIHKETVEWYMGFALLYSFEIDKALELFKEISENGVRYKDNASLVVIEIKNLLN